jgi:MoaA/NifB/PqqE/SkfB family radical SAM enzyme
MCGGAQRVKVGGLAPYYRLSLAEVKRLLGGAPLLSVTLAGGYAEPFLNKEIFRIAEFIRSQGGETRAVTNGTLIGRDFAKRIVEAGFSDLWVSIHGATPEVAQYVMEGSQFDVVIQNLKSSSHLRRYEVQHPRARGCRPARKAGGSARRGGQAHGHTAAKLPSGDDVVGE